MVLGVTVLVMEHFIVSIATVMTVVAMLVRSD